MPAIVKSTLKSPGREVQVAVQPEAEHAERCNEEADMPSNRCKRVLSQRDHLTGYLNKIAMALVR